MLLQRTLQISLVTHFSCTKKTLYIHSVIHVLFNMITYCTYTQQGYVFGYIGSEHVLVVWQYRYNTELATVPVCYLLDCIKTIMSLLVYQVQRFSKFLQQANAERQSTMPDHTFYANVLRCWLE